MPELVRFILEHEEPFKRYTILPPDASGTIGIADLQTAVAVLPRSTPTSDRK